MIKIINNQKRTCRSCGCNEDNRTKCIKKTGAPCYWVESDLCSSCESIASNKAIKPLLSQRLVRLMGWLIFTSIAFSILPSCNGPKYCGKYIRKAILGGCLDTTTKVRIVHDTTMKEVHDTGSNKIQFDTTGLYNKWKQDSCFTQSKTEEIIRYLKVKPINILDSNYQLKIWIDNGILKHDLKIKPCISTTTEKTVPAIIDKSGEKKLWNIIYLLGSILFLLILLIIVWLLIRSSKS